MNYDSMTCKNLKKLCKERKIKGYSKMKKAELINLLQQEQGPKPMRFKSPLLKRIQTIVKKNN